MVKEASCVSEICSDTKEVVLARPCIVRRSQLNAKWSLHQLSLWNTVSNREGSRLEMTSEKRSSQA